MANTENVRILTSMDKLWRVDVKVAQSHLSARSDNGISVTLNEVDLEDGQWVKYDANGDLVVTEDAAFQKAYMIFRGGADRFDNVATEMVTIIKGEFEGYSKKYKSGDTFALDTELAAGATGLLEEADSGDYVIGFAMGAPANSELHFTTYGAGYVKA